MRLGRFEIFPLLDGYFRLDGGAMFGVVPKVLWKKTTPRIAGTVSFWLLARYWFEPTESMF